MELGRPHDPEYFLAFGLFDTTESRVIKKQENDEEEAEAKRRAKILRFMCLKMLLHLSLFAHFAITNLIAL